MSHLSNSSKFDSRESLNSSADSPRESPKEKEKERRNSLKKNSLKREVDERLTQSQPLPSLGVSASPKLRNSTRWSQPPLDPKSTKRGSWIARIGAVVQQQQQPGTPPSPNREFHSSPNSSSATPRTSPVRRRAISVSEGHQSTSGDVTPESGPDSPHSRKTSRLFQFSFRTKDTKEREKAKHSAPAAEDMTIAEDGAEIKSIVEFLSQTTKAPSNPAPSNDANIPSLAQALELPILQRSIERLSELAKKDSNKGLLVASLPVLLSILQDSSKQSFYSTILTVIKNIVVTEKWKDHFRNQNGFLPLIGLLKIEDEQLQKGTLACLGFLMTNNKKNADAFIEHGGLPILVELLKSPSEIVKLLASGVTWVLASHESRHQEAIFKCGGHDYLIEILNTTSNVDIYWQAAGALRNIALKNEAIQEALFQKNVVRLLVSKLGSTPNEKAVGHLSAALLAMSDYRKVQSVAFEEGIFDTILTIIENSSPGIKEMNIDILKNLVLLNETNQTTLVKTTKTLPLLLQLTSDGNEHIRIHAFQALEALGEQNPLVAKEALDQGAIKCLFASISKDKSPKLCESGLNCLNTLCQACPEYATRIFSSLPSIIDLLKSSVGEIQEATASLLGTLAKIDEVCLSAIAKKEYISLLFEALSSKEYGVVENTVLALNTLFSNSNVAIEHSNLATLNKGMAIYRLVSFVLYEKEPVLQIDSCALLTILLADEHVKNMYTALGGATVVVQMLRSPHEKLVLYCLEIVYMTACNSTKFQMIWRDQGIVPVFTELFSNSSATIVARSLNTLRILVAGNGKVKDAFKSKNLLHDTFRLLSHKDASVKSAALQLLLVVSEDSNSMQGSLLKMTDSISIIVSNFSSDDAEVLYFTAKIISLLSSRNAKVQNAFKEAKAPEKLVALLGRSDQGVLIVALEAIVSLCTKNPANMDEFKKKGTVEILQAQRKSNADSADKIEEVLRIIEASK